MSNHPRGLQRPIGALLLLAVSPAFAGTLIEANFNTAPNTEDPNWTHSGFWDLAVTLNGGIAEYDTIDTDANVSIISVFPEAVSARARMRVLADDGYNGGGTSIVMIQNGYMFVAGIVSSNAFHDAALNALNAGAVTQSFPMDTSVFHEYRVEITDVTNGVYDVYVDDVAVLTNNAALSIGAGFDGQIQFGDNEGTADAQAELDWVRVADASGPEQIVPVTPVVVADTESVDIEAVGRFTYRLETTDDLLAGTFDAAPGYVIGERGPLTLTAPPGTNAADDLYYRVVVDGP